MDKLIVRFILQFNLNKNPIFDFKPEYDRQFCDQIYKTNKSPLIKTDFDFQKPKSRPQQLLKFSKIAESFSTDDLV